MEIKTEDERKYYKMIDLASPVDTEAPKAFTRTGS